MFVYHEHVFMDVMTNIVGKMSAEALAQSSQRCAFFTLETSPLAMQMGCARMCGAVPTSQFVVL